MGGHAYKADIARQSDGHVFLREGFNSRDVPLVCPLCHNYPVAHGKTEVERPSSPGRAGLLNRKCGLLSQQSSLARDGTPKSAIFIWMGKAPVRRQGAKLHVFATGGNGGTSLVRSLLAAEIEFLHPVRLFLPVSLDLRPLVSANNLALRHAHSTKDFVHGVGKGRDGAVPRSIGISRSGLSCGEGMPCRPRWRRCGRAAPVLFHPSVSHDLEKFVAVAFSNSQSGPSTPHFPGQGCTCQEPGRDFVWPADPATAGNS